MIDFGSDEDGKDEPQQPGSKAPASDPPGSLRQPVGGRGRRPPPRQPPKAQPQGAHQPAKQPVPASAAQPQSELAGLEGNIANLMQRLEELKAKKGTAGSRKAARKPAPLKAPAGAARKAAVAVAVAAVEGLEARAGSSRPPSPPLTAGPAAAGTRATPEPRPTGSLESDVQEILNALVEESDHVQSEMSLPPDSEAVGTRPSSSGVEQPQQQAVPADSSFGFQLSLSGSLQGQQTPTLCNPATTAAAVAAAAAAGAGARLTPAPRPRSAAGTTAAAGGSGAAATAATAAAAAALGGVGSGTRNSAAAKGAKTRKSAKTNSGTAAVVTAATAPSTEQQQQQRKQAGAGSLSRPESRSQLQQQEPQPEEEQHPEERTAESGQQQLPGPAAAAAAAPLPIIGSNSFPLQLTTALLQQAPMGLPMATTAGAAAGAAAGVSAPPPRLPPLPLIPTPPPCPQQTQQLQQLWQQLPQQQQDVALGLIEQQQRHLLRHRLLEAEWVQLWGSWRDTQQQLEQLLPGNAAAVAADLVRMPAGVMLQPQHQVLQPLQPAAAPQLQASGSAPVAVAGGLAAAGTGAAGTGAAATATAAGMGGPAAGTGPAGTGARTGAAAAGTARAGGAGSGQVLAVASTAGEDLDSSLPVVGGKRQAEGAREGEQETGKRQHREALARGTAVKDTRAGAESRAESRGDKSEAKGDELHARGKGAATGGRMAEVDRQGRRARSRSRSREREADRGKGRERERGRSFSPRSVSPRWGRSREREKERGGELEKGLGRDRSAAAGRGQVRGRSPASPEQVWGRDRGREREVDREREKERERDKEREREGEREKDRVLEREREKERGLERERAKERDREKERERERERETGWELGRGRESRRASESEGRARVTASSDSRRERQREVEKGSDHGGQKDKDGGRAEAEVVKGGATSRRSELEAAKVSGQGSGVSSSGQGRKSSPGTGTRLSRQPSGGELQIPPGWRVVGGSSNQQQGQKESVKAKEEATRTGVATPATTSAAAATPAAAPPVAAATPAAATPAAATPPPAAATPAAAAIPASSPLVAAPTPVAAAAAPYVASERAGLGVGPPMYPTAMAATSDPTAAHLLHGGPLGLPPPPGIITTAAAAAGAGDMTAAGLAPASHLQSQQQQQQQVVKKRRTQRWDQPLPAASAAAPAAAGSVAASFVSPPLPQTSTAAAAVQPAVPNPAGPAPPLRTAATAAAAALISEATVGVGFCVASVVTAAAPPAPAPPPAHVPATTVGLGALADQVSAAVRSILGPQAVSITQQQQQQQQQQRQQQQVVAAPGGVVVDALQQQMSEDMEIDSPRPLAVPSQGLLSPIVAAPSTAITSTSPRQRNQQQQQSQQDDYAPLSFKISGGKAGKVTTRLASSPAKTLENFEPRAGQPSGPSGAASTEAAAIPQQQQQQQTPELQPLPLPPAASKAAGVAAAGAPVQKVDTPDVAGVPAAAGVAAAAAGVPAAAGVAGGGSSRQTPLRAPQITNSQPRGGSAAATAAAAGRGSGQQQQQRNSSSSGGGGGGGSSGGISCDVRFASPLSGLFAAPAGRIRAGGSSPDAAAPMKEPFGLANWHELQEAVFTRNSSSSSSNKKQAAQKPTVSTAMRSRYRSPLLVFRSYRLSPGFAMSLSPGASGGPLGSSYCHALDPHWPLCKFELRGSHAERCCGYQHWGDGALSLQEQLGEVKGLLGRAGVRDMQGVGEKVKQQQQQLVSVGAVRNGGAGKQQQQQQQQAGGMDGTGTWQGVSLKQLAATAAADGGGGEGEGQVTWGVLLQANVPGEAGAVAGVAAARVSGSSSSGGSSVGGFEKKAVRQVPALEKAAAVDEAVPCYTVPRVVVLGAAAVAQGDQGLRWKRQRMMQAAVVHAEPLPPLLLKLWQQQQHVVSLWQQLNVWGRPLPGVDCYSLKLQPLATAAAAGGPGGYGVGARGSSSSSSGGAGDCAGGDPHGQQQQQQRGVLKACQRLLWHGPPAEDQGLLPAAGGGPGSGPSPMELEHSTSPGEPAPAVADAAGNGGGSSGSGSEVDLSSSSPSEIDAYFLQLEPTAAGKPEFYLRWALAHLDTTTSQDPAAAAGGGGGGTAPPAGGRLMQHPPERAAGAIRRGFTHHAAEPRLWLGTMTIMLRRAGFGEMLRKLCGRATDYCRSCYQLWVLLAGAQQTWQEQVVMLVRGVLGLGEQGWEGAGGDGLDEQQFLQLRVNAVLDLVLRMVQVLSEAGQRELLEKWAGGLAVAAESEDIRAVPGAAGGQEAALAAAAQDVAAAGTAAVAAELATGAAELSSASEGGSAAAAVSGLLHRVLLGEEIGGAMRDLVLLLVEMRPMQAAVLWLSLAHVIATGELPTGVRQRLGHLQEPEALTREVFVAVKAVDIGEQASQEAAAAAGGGGEGVSCGKAIASEKSWVVVGQLLMAVVRGKSVGGVDMTPPHQVTAAAGADINGSSSSISNRYSAEQQIEAVAAQQVVGLSWLAALPHAAKLQLSSQVPSPLNRWVEGVPASKLEALLGWEVTCVSQMSKTPWLVQDAVKQMRLALGLNLQMMWPAEGGGGGVGVGGGAVAGSDIDSSSCSRGGGVVNVGVGAPAGEVAAAMVATSRAAAVRVQGRAKRQLLQVMVQLCEDTCTAVIKNGGGPGSGSAGGGGGKAGGDGGKLDAAGKMNSSGSGKQGAGRGGKGGHVFKGASTSSGGGRSQGTARAAAAAAGGSDSTRSSTRGKSSSSIAAAAGGGAKSPKPSHPWTQQELQNLLGNPASRLLAPLASADANSELVLLQPLWGLNAAVAVAGGKRKVALLLLGALASGHYKAAGHKGGFLESMPDSKAVRAAFKILLGREGQRGQVGEGGGGGGAGDLSNQQQQGNQQQQKQQQEKQQQQQDKGPQSLAGLLPTAELRCSGWLNAAAYEALSGNWGEAIAGYKAAVREAAGDEGLLAVAWREYLLLLSQLAAATAANTAAVATGSSSCSGSSGQGGAGDAATAKSAAGALAVAEQCLVDAVLEAVACFVQLHSGSGGDVPALQLPVLTYPCEPEVEVRWHPAGVVVHGWMEQVLGEVLGNMMTRRQVRPG